MHVAATIDAVNKFISVSPKKECTHRIRQVRPNGDPLSIAGVKTFQFRLAGSFASRKLCIQPALTVERTALETPHSRQSRTGDNYAV